MINKLKNKNKTKHDEKNNEPPQPQAATVAVIGGGVAGLAAAWHLQEVAGYTSVSVYEAQDRLGGHAWTVNVPLTVSTNEQNHDDDDNANNNNIDVDVGFMVFNDDNYPNMTAWFQALKVETEDSDMSLSVSLDHGKSIEWSSDGLSGLLANKKQLLSPSFYTFLYDMIRFNNEAPHLLLLADDDPRKHVTTRQYLHSHKYSLAFCQYYLLPMMAALWSASLTDVLQFPAAQLIGFLCNHKMLQLFDRPQWKTVKGRSQQYVQQVEMILKNNVHVNTPVHRITRQQHPDKTGLLYSLWNAQNECLQKDVKHVIFACHPPTASQILERSNNDDNDGAFDKPLLDALRQIAYADNVIYVHSDPKLMPSRKAAWASWNCLGKKEHLSIMGNSSSSAQQQQSSSSPFDAKKKGAFEGAESGFGNTLQEENGEDSNNNNNNLDGPEGRMKAVYVTYWLNRLQNLQTNQDIFVSLNPHHAPAKELTHHRFILAHPQFSPQTLSARNTILQTKQGKDNLWFCGAWSGYGFHEDGCRSGFEVATSLSKVPLPWAKTTQPVLPPPDLALATISSRRSHGIITALLSNWYRRLTYDWPIAVCKQFIFRFLEAAVQKGTLRLHMNDGSYKSFGDGSLCGCDEQPVTLRVFVRNKNVFCGK